MTRAWTLGHSVHPTDTFFEILAGPAIKTLVDVRRYPVSRRNPQFHSVELKKACFQRGIRYEWMGDELGGHREPRPTSKHVGLSNPAFRGYADWMETPTFQEGVRRLLGLLQESPTAYMCAERPPSNCHRQLLSDHLALVHAVDVVNLSEPGSSRPYQPTPGARREGDGVVFERPVGRKKLDDFAENN